MAMLFCVFFLFLTTVSSGSKTLTSTRNELQRFAKDLLPSGVGRFGDSETALPFRTSFYKALSDIERSIKYAEANFKPYPAEKRTRNLLKLRKSIVSAAKNGNYKLGRELFGFARYLEDTASNSISRKRMKRSSNDIISYIKEKIGDQTFKEFFNIESGTTLTFILDTTGSMQEDIQQVRNIIRGLADTGDEGKYTFLVAPFKDPDYGPLLSYTDKGELLSALETLSVDGGGDCDEMVMHGISEGLHETEAYSPVFVFTDAGSKDLDELDSVLILAQTLFSPLYFFLTPSPECSKDISSYEELAQESSGQVLSLSKEELGNMRDFVRSAAIGKSNIRAGDESTEGSSSGTGKRRSTGSSGSGTGKRSTGQTHNIEFHCDDTVDKLLVTLNFETPNGSSYLLSPSRTLVVPVFVSAITNMRLYEVVNPQPGKWSLKAITDVGGKFTYKVNSVSPTNVDFDFYLTKMVRGKELLAEHAVPGDLMHLKLNVLGGLDLIKHKWSIVFLIDTRGNVISTVQSLALSQEYEFQYDGLFIVPEESFKIMVYGETKDGYPFTRTSQGTITPSYGILRAFHTVNTMKDRLLRPGTRGSFYFMFEHFSDTTTDFVVSFSNPKNIILSSSPYQLQNVKKWRHKLIRLPYSIPRNTPEGTEYRISIVIEGGEVKSKIVHTILVTRFGK